jgi:hypothetical protein
MLINFVIHYDIRSNKIKYILPFHVNFSAVSYLNAVLYNVGLLALYEDGYPQHLSVRVGVRMRQ